MQAMARIHNFGAVLQQQVAHNVLFIYFFCDGITRPNDTIQLISWTACVVFLWVSIYYFRWISVLAFFFSASLKGRLIKYSGNDDRLKVNLTSYRVNHVECHVMTAKRLTLYDKVWGMMPSLVNLGYLSLTSLSVKRVNFLNPLSKSGLL